MKAYRRREGVAPLVLNFGNTWTEWSTSHPSRFQLVNFEQEVGWAPGPLQTFRRTVRSVVLVDILAP